MPRCRPSSIAALVCSLGLAAGTALFAEESAGDTTCREREARYDRFIDFGLMVQGGTVEPAWMADGRRFTYATDAPDGTAFFVVEAKTGKQEPLFDTGRLRKALAEPLGDALPESGLPFDAFIFVDDESAIEFAAGGRTFRLDLKSYRVTEQSTPEVGQDAENDAVETPSPDGRWIVVTRDDDLWYRRAEDDEIRRLTTDGDPDFTWSAEGAKWSSDGTRFAVQRFDARKIHKMPVVQWLGHSEEVDWRPYAYAGEPRYAEQLAVVDLAGGKVTHIDTGEEPEQLHVLLDWRQDDSELLFLRFDRGMKQVDLMAADPASGTTRSIVSDRQATFIEGLHLYFTTDCFHYPLEDDRHFIWRSERDGWAHFYLYRYDGELVRRLTEGEFEVHQVLAVDRKKEWVYFTAQADLAHPYDRHLYRVDLQGRRMKQLTEGTGPHRVSLGPALTGFVDNHSAFDRPPAAELRSMDGKRVSMLAQADVAELDALGWKPPEEFTVQAADGETTMYGMLYKPHDLDPGRKYPVIEVIYAGSLMPAVSRTFVPHEYGHFAQTLAQLGFVTVVLDARGTPGRGKAFQDVVYRSIGRNEIPDHVAALQQLAADRPYMDMRRVGVHGKSWGGYFALRAMLQAPDVYHVGVASAIAADLETTAYSPIVPYMESPEENPEGYAFASNLKMADRLQGKLLITAATGDVNTPFAQTMKMVDALIQAGKPVDLMVFPDQHHWLQGASLDYFYEMLKDYFVEHLKPDGCPN